MSVAGSDNDRLGIKAELKSYVVDLWLAMTGMCGKAAPSGAWPGAYITRHFRAGLSRSAPSELGLGIDTPCYRQP